MANVINLNKYRKRKAKADREKQAETNRRLHGRTRAERAHDELQKKQLTRTVEGARLETRAAKPATTEQHGHEQDRESLEAAEGVDASGEQDGVDEREPERPV